jgi:hypothetical protein
MSFYFAWKKKKKVCEEGICDTDYSCAVEKVTSCAAPDFGSRASFRHRIRRHLGFSARDCQGLCGIGLGENRPREFAESCGRCWHCYS